MPIDLYYDDGSPPCHLVRLVAAALGISFNMKRVDVLAGHHLKPEYLKINPQHKVPSIVDGDLTLWESRAISRYLVNQYAKGSRLYPEEPKARALVDRLLDFDYGVLYNSFGDYFYPPLFGAKPDEDRLKTLKEALGFLNTLLEGCTYAAGPELTLADLALVASVSTIEIADIDLKPYPNILKWYKLVKSTAKKYNEIMDEGVQLFQDYATKERARHGL